MKEQSIFRSLLIIGILTAWGCVALGEASTCPVPDNGTGTVDIPPNCPLTSDAGSPVPIGTLDGTFTVDSFFDVFYLYGGDVSGGMMNFSANLTLSLTSRCDPTFLREVNLNVRDAQMLVGPRVPGAAVQSFDTEIVAMQGELFGDPDFDTLTITASPYHKHHGHVTVLKIAAGGGGGDFTVDSFFDITYRIDYQGTANGALGGQGGTVLAPVRLSSSAFAVDSFFDVFCGISSVEFGNPTSQIPAIPADFFGPGSDPFTGLVNIGSSGLDGVRITRLEELRFANTSPSSDTVDIEIVALSLKSCDPITVSYLTGTIELWDVEVGGGGGGGTLRATKTHDNGGTFDMQLFFEPNFVFTEVGNPNNTRTVQTKMVSLSRSSAAWVVESPKKKAGEVCNGIDDDCDGFYPINNPPLILAGGGMNLDLRSPEPVRVHFLLSSYDDWSTALADGRIHPMPASMGNEYIDQLNANLLEGESYPMTQFREAQLSVLGKGEYSEKAGLLMVWGDDEPGPFYSAWMYTYPEDPDLTNSTVSVTADPPCGMAQISIGMQDINGNTCTWFWNVAPAGAIPPYPTGTIPCNPSSGPLTTVVSINTSLSGLAAATPTAAGFSCMPGFDITLVTDFIFDENNILVGQTQAPVPGSGQVANWNYWHTLIITPNPPSNGNGTGTVNSKWYTKWSQPPVEIAPGLINGWDEYSNYHNKPIMADDWQCEDTRPITDIHWWGSFIGWTQPSLPPQLPIAFHIGIWTDVPADPATGMFSHPDKLIWENYCDTSIWNFAGYELDPTNTDPDRANDACFQFAQFLSQDEWFHQEPMDADGTPNVYWVSISAIYDPTVQVLYPWGWTTRPHFFNDDAVRIHALQSGAWPPTLGDSWLDGVPVEYPQGVSWDLAFELTTNQPSYEDEPIPGDIGGPNGQPDGVVDLFDFQVIAANFLNAVVVP